MLTALMQMMQATSHLRYALVKLTHKTFIEPVAGADVTDYPQCVMSSTIPSTYGAWLLAVWLATM